MKMVNFGVALIARPTGISWICHINKIAQGLVFDAIPLRMCYSVTENLKEGAVVRPKLTVSPR